MSLGISIEFSSFSCYLPDVYIEEFNRNKKLMNFEAHNGDILGIQKGYFLISGQFRDL